MSYRNTGVPSLSKNLVYVFHPGILFLTIKPDIILILEG